MFEEHGVGWLTETIEDEPIPSSQDGEMSSRPAIESWHALVQHLDISRGDLTKAADLSTANGTSLPEELFAARLITQDRYFRALSDLLGLRFQAEIDPAFIVMGEVAGVEALSRSSDLPPIRYCSTRF